MIKNVIFDWSGTLSDDLTPFYNAAMLMFEKLGGKQISLDEFKKEFKQPYMLFWNQYFPKLTKEKEYELYKEAIYQVEEPKCYEGVREVIERLHALDIDMIVISSYLADKLISEAKNYGIFDFFKELNGNIYDKAEVIAGILARNGFDPKETIYVGDTTHDIDAGKAASVRTVAITWGYQSEDQLRQAKPDHIITNISEVVQLLN